MTSLKVIRNEDIERALIGVPKGSQKPSRLHEAKGCTSAI